MAARTRKPFQDERTRQSIQVRQLVNLLQNDALGRLVDPTGKAYALSDGRRKSAEIVLRKALPDLSAIDHTGNVEQHYIVHMPSPVKDLGEWREVYGVVEEKPALQIDAKPAEPIAVNSALPAKDD